WNLSFSRASRSKHATTLEYFCGPVSYEGELLARWDLSQIDENELETTLFGIPLEVKAENKGAIIEAKLEFGGEENDGSGTNFVLVATDSGITVKVIVNAPIVEIRYWASFMEPPYPRQILITDVVLESV
ncbi:MAG: hypothetical protein ACK4GQ_06385, partial [Candidatus Hadarchaeales archaeon]